MNTSHIKQVVSSVRRKMGPTRCLSAARSVRSNDNDYPGRIELDSHADTIVLGRNCVILTYTVKEYEVSPYSDKHRWELPGNYPVFTVVMVIYHYVERIWRVLVTPIILYNIYDHE